MSTLDAEYTPSLRWALTIHQETYQQTLKADFGDLNEPMSPVCFSQSF